MPALSRSQRCSRRRNLRAPRGERYCSPIVRVRALVWLLLAAAGGVAAPGAAQGQGPAPQPLRANDFGGFMDVLPPGANGTANPLELGAFLTTGARPANSDDQLAMYHRVTGGRDLRQGRRARDHPGQAAAPVRGALRRAALRATVARVVGLRGRGCTDDARERALSLRRRQRHRVLQLGVEPPAPGGHRRPAPHPVQVCLGGLRPRDRPGRPHPSTSIPGRSTASAS